jgi:hypothetical protein
MDSAEKAGGSLPPSCEQGMNEARRLNNPSLIPCLVHHYAVPPSACLYSNPEFASTIQTGLHVSG